MGYRLLSRLYLVVSAVAVSIVVLLLSADSVHAHSDPSAVTEVGVPTFLDDTHDGAELHCHGTSCGFAAINRSGQTFYFDRPGGSSSIEQSTQQITSIAPALEPPPPRL